MEQNSLPRTYSDTLRSGLWDNCDILPETETAQQGEGGCDKSGEVVAE